MANKIEDKIIKISDQVLNILLEFRKKNPDFTFSLRQRDSPQSKDKRLEKGFWFQGSNYIYVPLFKKGDNARKLKTLGFVVGFSKDGENHSNYIEISFKVGSNEKEKAFHKELADFYNIELNKDNVGYYKFPSNDYKNNIDFYLNDFRNKALELLKKYSIKDQFIISEDQFEKALNKITIIRESKTSSNKENNNLLQQDIIQNNDMKLPLNQILYGPPGTGKTHKLLNEYYIYFEVQNKTVSKKEFEFDIINQLSWWQVFALVLLENKNATVPDIKKHRFVDYKLQVSNTKSLSQTVWGQLSAHTIEDSDTVQYGKRIEPLIFNKSAGSVWEIVEDKKELIDELLELSQKIQDYREVIITSKNYKFITFHQSFSYEDFIEGIKPILNKELSDESSEVSYAVEKGIFYECCNEAAKLAGFLSLKDSIENYSKEERVSKYKNASPYGLFIDEINRGNISQIFGELITLIEDTKRLGRDEVIVELPYSKSKFSVPPNLHIIGTMNTADRSTEAIDTALRRRFTFEEMLPKPFLLEDKNIGTVNLEEVLTIINKRIEVLLDRDHTIGHSYFINVKNENDLRNTFKNNIIPLLQEYFYGDYEKIGMVLGMEFFEEFEKFDNSLFAKFQTENYPQGGRFFRLKTITQDFEINKAIETLMNKKVIVGNV